MTDTAMTDAATARLLDGGLATTLEGHGHDLSGGLWSARLLLADPEAVQAVHEEFFQAGAEVATTASYQASALSLRLAGYPTELADELIDRSVEVARTARDASCPSGRVVGSVGAYGASLADGSEYTGRYGLAAADQVATLTDFHRPRAERLLAAGADELAFETLPSAAEVAGVARVIAHLRCPAWVSLTPAPGGTRTRADEPIADAVRPLRALVEDGLPLLAVGVNCCAPDDVRPALSSIAATLPGTDLIAYPNSGQTWDAARQQWQGEPTWRDELVAEWLDAGVRHLGGCCQVAPAQIARLNRHLTTR